jgi:eukaryotic-like serine/threonine-protein kinase
MQGDTPSMTSKAVEEPAEGRSEEATRTLGSRSGTLHAGELDGVVDEVHAARARAVVMSALFGEDSEAVRVGRFTILELLGAGAMGRVYEAHDPQLDRHVALKLVRTVGPHERAQRERILREAQAIAKLAHPNVVPVFEVGEDAGRPYLVMERIEGETLRKWQALRPRSRAEILDVFEQAGRGLAAAHAADVVHRDFKPDNVLVGRDGRARIVDFGLACNAPPPSTADGEDDATSGTARWVGTPAYMAPEQFMGQEADASADQFAFCVALWEALHGERPFGGTSLAEISANVINGRRRPPPKRSVIPSRLRRLCERGLAIDPQQRWPAMEALLAELQRLRAPRRWWVLGVVGGLAMVGMGIAQYAEQGLRCTGAAEQLEGTWDAGRRQAVKHAILGTGLSYAPDTWVRVELRLDEYAGAWASKHTEICQATSVRQEQSPEVMDLRMECLRARRIALRDAVGVLAEADPTRVEKAVELASGLPGLSRCDEVEVLQAELALPEDPRAAARVEALREQLVRARTLRKAGVYDEALAEAAAVVEEAETLVYAPLLAEALLERSYGRNQVAQYTEAEQDAERAYTLAAQYGHDEVEAQAVSHLVWVVGVIQARHEPGLQWGKTALPLAKGLRFEPAVEAHALDNIGRVLSHQAKLEDALAYFQRALAIFEEALGPRHPAVANSLDNIGRVLMDQGAVKEALAHHQRALAIFEEALGPRHPAVANALDSIGGALGGQGELEAGLTHLQRALAIREEALGPRHPDVARSLVNLGVVLARQGQLEDALSHFQRALAIFEEASGPRHPDVASSLDDIGLVLGRQGRLEDALSHFQRALAIWEQALGPHHPDVASSLDSIGTVLLDQGELEDALTHFQRALAIWEQALGPHHSDVAYPLVGLAEVALAKHDPEDARAHAERAVAVREAGETSPELLAEARFVLAQALWSDRSQRARAHTLAEQARDAYTELGEGEAEHLAEVQTWLAEHRVP